MNRFLILTILLVGSLEVLAQPAIGRSDFYHIGDVVQYRVVDPGNVQPGPAGNGVTWDFRGMTRNSAEDYEIRFQAPSVAPNAANFPEANMVQVQDTGDYTAYSFLLATDDMIRLEGLDIPDLGVVTYSDKSLWANLPFTFGETQTDAFIGQYTFNVSGVSGISHRTGDLTTTYDGYGTLILPDGQSFSGARRLKLEQTVNDEIVVQGFSITTTVDTITYQWFIPGNGNQAFSITYATTTISTTGTSVESVVAVYQEVEDTGSGGTTVTRGTHLTAQGGDFDTELLIHNPTNSAKTLTLKPYSSTGSEGQNVTVNLPAGTTTRSLQQSYFNPDAASFSASGCDECIFSMGYRAAHLEDASTAQVHQNSRVETDFFIYPGEWEVLFDGAAIINAGTAAATIDAVQLDDSGHQIAKVNIATNLAAGGKKLTIFNTLFDNIPNTMIKLESTQPISVMMLRIDQEGRYLYQNLPLPNTPEAGDARWLAHITATSESGGFDTDILLHNTSGSSKSVTLQPYDSTGHALNPVSETVAANATSRFAKLDLFGADASHVKITGATEVLVTAGYRARVENASTAQIHEAEPVGNSFTIYPGNWDVLFDGFAIVNTGNATTSLRVSQINDDGTTTTPVILTDALAPNAKFLGLLEGKISNNPNSIIKVEADQPLAILALRLTKDSRYLYGNEVLP